MKRHVSSSEFRRILLDGVVTDVTLNGDELVSPDGRRVRERDAHYLAPVDPTKIICVHLNYRSRVDELRWDMPETPSYFQKPTSCLNAHRGAVVVPPNCSFLNYEGEFAVVVGRRARNVEPHEALKYVAGFTVANDFGLHDFRGTDRGSMLRVKGSDTLGPVGPGIVTDWDYRGRRLQTLVNGRVVQEARTDELVFDVEYLITDLTRLITLNPGDLILTGTPANSRPVDAGDTVTVRVEGLGELESRIVAGSEPISSDAGAMPQSGHDVERIALGSDYRTAASN